MSLLFPRVAFYPAQSHCGRRQAYNNAASAHPFFQALEETLGELANAGKPSPSQRQQHCQRQQYHRQRIFNPRFDIKEIENEYVLEGELPGVEQNNISIEFLDEATLQITGHRESAPSAPTSTPEPSTSVEKAQEPLKDDNATIVEDSASTKSTISSTSASKQATVEDEESTNEWIDIPTASDEHARPTSASSEKAAEEEEKSTTASAEEQPHQQQQQQTQQKSWLKERSHGSFNRTFRFESRVDRDLVKASLKNGILTVTVPKAAVPEVRRIRID